MMDKREHIVKILAEDKLDEFKTFMSETPDFHDIKFQDGYIIHYFPCFDAYQCFQYFIDNTKEEKNIYKTTESFLIEVSQNIYCPIIGGRSFMHIAVEHNCPDMIKYALQKGIKQTYDDYGYQPQDLTSSLDILKIFGINDATQKFKDYPKLQKQVVSELRAKQIEQQKNQVPECEKVNKYLYEMDLQPHLELDHSKLEINEIKSGSQIFTIKKLITPQLCSLLCQEIIDILNQNPNIKAPNSMNKYGFPIKLSYLQTPIDYIIRNCFFPLKDLLGLQKNQLNDYYAFTIVYYQGKETQLDMHTDSSLWTVNICLGEIFEGIIVHQYSYYLENKTYFVVSQEGERIDVDHEMGQALVHFGNVPHGTYAIKSGRRANLVVWFKA